MKKLLKSDLAVTCISALATAYIWFVYKTTRWRRINDEVPMQMVKDGKPFIIAFWHGRLLMMAPLLPSHGKFSVMISQHGDGELIARTVKPLGVDSVRGSSSQGGAAAFKELLKVTKRNEVAIITPDGPRGPRMRAQKGIVAIAAMTGLPIFPVSFATTRMKYLKSWDRFALAKPFAKGVMVWGDPIYVPRKDENGAHERMKRVIEEQLTQVTQSSDQLCCQQPVEPAPAEEVVKKNQRVT
ncbi:lysophospholipid acyltransferase family protein [Sneathiella glossodoripedis]|uniref:lysophospholipid acyltransferase family protein n=1 Tax=Sneathiella glossodoripedis TaxID=418853 RepID=UPI000561A948|nr:lysophospholipid acyltransferase family protein [Sneathiella glossodoripedis]